MKENAFKKDIEYSKKEFDMEQRMEKTRSKVALASEELENAMDALKNNVSLVNDLKVKSDERRREKQPLIDALKKARVQAQIAMDTLKMKHAAFKAALDELKSLRLILKKSARESQVLMANLQRWIPR